MVKSWLQEEWMMIHLITIFPVQNGMTQKVGCGLIQFR